MVKPRAKAFRPLIDTVVAAKVDAGEWHDARQKVMDANCVLESLLAELGLEATVTALANQGLSADDYRYVLRPLVEEAVARRQARSDAAA